MIRSMEADMPNHEPSLLLMNCGEARLAAAQHGSWLTYGLGSENQNLPGFVAMCPGGLPDPGIAELAVGLSAGRLPGNLRRHAAHRDREADREHPRTSYRPRSSSGGSSTCWRAQRGHLAEARARSAAGSPHPIVRAGLSHADARRPRLSTSAASRSTCSTCTAPARKPGKF